MPLPICVFFLAGFLSVAATQEPPPPQPAESASPERIAALLAELGHDDFERRETATLELIRLGLSAESALAKLEKETRDPEVAQRCERVRGALSKPEQTALGVLKCIETSGATFLRPGGSRGRLAGSAFARHLQGKAWLSRFSLTGPARAFIDQVATASSLHGTAYRVVLPDGTETDLKDWLYKKLKLE